VLSKVPLIGLTATATPRVRTDILGSLQLRNPFVSQLSLDRANLKIHVHRKMGIPDAMKEFLDSTTTSTTPASTIIYAPTRAMVESIHQYLVSHNVSCEAYHAGLADRANAHTNFLTGKTAVLVATTAFGMVRVEKLSNGLFSLNSIVIVIVRVLTSRTFGRLSITVRPRRWKSTISRLAELAATGYRPAASSTRTIRTLTRI
jgi:hypothetical protein